MTSRRARVAAGWLSAAAVVTVVACGKGDTPAPPATPAPAPETKAEAPPPPATPAVNPQVEALVKEGKVKYALGDLAASKEALGKALALDPAHAEAKQYMARAEAARAAAATPAPSPATPAVLAPTEEDRAKSIDALLKEGEELLKQEKFAAPPEANAFIKFRAVLEREPLNRRARAGITAAIDACKRKGNEHLGSASYVQAMMYFAQAESMAPSDAEVRELVARCRAQMGGQALPDGPVTPPPTVPSPAPPPAPVATPAPATPPPPPSPSPTPPHATAAPPATPTATPPPIVDGRRAAWLKSKAPATYPRAAWEKGVEGTVVLKVLVGSDGSVADVQVQASSGHVELDQAAVDASRGYRFEPAIEGGKAVPQWVSVAVAFDKP